MSNRHGLKFPKSHPAYGKDVAERRRWIARRDAERIAAGREAALSAKRRALPKQPQTPAWMHWPEYEHLLSSPSRAVKDHAGVSGSNSRYQGTPRSGRATP